MSFLYPSLTSTPSKTMTVQLLVTDEKDRILLVHERGEGVPARRAKPQIGSKPAGWGLPGGGIDEKKNEQQLLEQIMKFLTVYRIEERCFKEMPYAEEIDLRLYLTAVKEGIEETGLLIYPVTILLEEPNSPSHMVVVMSGQFLAGEIQKRSIETDDCGWFNLEHLPHGIYQSHIKRILRGFKVLGRDDLVHKITIDEEKVIQEAV